MVHLPVPPGRPRPASGRTRLLVLPVLIVLAAMAACSSSSSPASSSTALYGTALQQQCTAVAAVLSDGPDPDADPVGYAEAQVLPLRHLELADTALHRAVQSLAGAYQAYSVSTGAANTAAALQASKAEAAVNAICPGAAN